jgi:chloride channel protein, CIC family
MERPLNPLNLITERLETGRVVLYGIGVGVLVGLAGLLFMGLLDLLVGLVGLATGLAAPGLASEGGVLQLFAGDRRWLLPPLLAAALAALAFLRAKPNQQQALGDGLDATLAVYHLRQGQWGIREALARLAAGILTLAAGLPFGREGPLSVLATGLGSLLVRLARLSERDARLVFLAALAAGLGIVLRAPLAGAVLAVEILYRRFEFEVEVLTPAVLASVVAYALYGALRGFAPLLEVPNFAGVAPALLPAFFLLGFVEAAAAAGVVAADRALTLAWGSLPVPLWLRLALVGLLSGVVLVFVPEAYGDGLGWLQLLLAGFVPISLVLVLLFWRTLIVLAAGSAGAAGGQLVPSLVLGGLIGNLFAQALSALGLSLDAGAFTLTGMAAFLAAAANVPLAATLLITEWAGYGLLLPLFITSLAGYLLTGGQSLYQNQVESRRDSPVHVGEYMREVVERRSELVAERRGELVAERRGEVLAEAEGQRESEGETNPKSEGEKASQPAAPELAAPERLNVANPVPDLLDLIEGQSLAVSDDDAERLYRLALPPPWVGSSVRMLEWPQNSLLVAVVRRGRIEVPRGDTVLELGDDLVVMATPESYARLIGTKDEQRNNDSGGDQDITLAIPDSLRRKASDGESAQAEQRPSEE